MEYAEYLSAGEQHYGLCPDIVAVRRDRFFSEHGLALCVTAAVPLVVYSSLENSSDLVIMALTALLLVLVAIGVYLIIRVSMIRESYDILLEEGDYKAEEKLDKEGRRKLRIISGIYWCSATALYLGWSFVTMAWGRTWVVWPVAGVLFAVVVGISKLCLKKKR